jgi:thiazole synthase ThiGH ThiG subunit
VREELLDGSDAVGGVSTPDKGSGHHFPEIFDVAKEEIVLVAVVRVEGGAADVGAIENMLDSDGFKVLFVHQGDEGVAEAVTCGANAAVEFLWDW